MGVSELLVADLWAADVSIDYPVGLICGPPVAYCLLAAGDLAPVPEGTRVTVAGIVTHGQRPPAAGGITFLSLEDVTGLLNVFGSMGVERLHARRPR